MLSLRRPSTEMMREFLASQSKLSFTGEKSGDDLIERCGRRCGLLVDRPFAA